MRKTFNEPDPLLDPLDGRPNITLREAAEALGKGVEAVRRGLIAGHIPGGYQSGPRARWRIRRKIFHAWLKEQIKWTS